MSKLDRQVNEINAIKPLVIEWRAFDDVDTLSLERQIRTAVLAAEHRVPLDCRNVDGAPNELVELLLRSNGFARKYGKQVTLSFASDELRTALRPGVYHRDVTMNHGTEIDAATAAAESLKVRSTAALRANAPPLAIENEPAATQPKDRRKRILKLAGFVVIGTASVAAAEFYLVFNEQNISLFAEHHKPQAIKTFENNVSPTDALLPNGQDTR